MKKMLILFAAVSLMAPGLVNAEETVMGMRKGDYGLAGCGLGSMVFESNSKTSQVFAATTNGTFGTQTFGISSETSNCTSGGLAKLEKEKELFVSMNFEILSQEMAQGSGEVLQAFAHLYGCSNAYVAEFGEMTKANYETSLADANTPVELLHRVDAQVASDAVLAEACVSTL